MSASTGLSRGVAERLQFRETNTVADLFRLCLPVVKTISRWTWEESKRYQRSAARGAGPSRGESIGCGSSSGVSSARIRANQRAVSRWLEFLEDRPALLRRLRCRELCVWRCESARTACRKHSLGYPSLRQQLSSSRLRMASASTPTRYRQSPIYDFPTRRPHK
jgi:hypothetical protein